MKGIKKVKFVLKTERPGLFIRVFFVSDSIVV